MVSPKETFLAHADAQGFDPTVDGLRRNLTEIKLAALQQVRGLDEAGLKEVMPGLYQKIVVMTIQIAAHVGLGVGLALEALDEARTGASISQFSREVRNQMTETGVALKRRNSNQLAKLVAEIEVQRLAWRHNHEFLSWLGFRRGDSRYPVKDRRERLDAFKVRQRLLKCRDAVIELLGPSLATALEAHDRFMLANRWRLAPTAEHSVERYIWPLLSYQPGPTVLLEMARYEYDAQRDNGADDSRLKASRKKLALALRKQLAESLNDVPEAACAGVIF
ncbi:MAG: hypothetical protein ACPG4T_00470 [Nannocystaceae bacterium]